jgi:hypothetical protein
MRDLNLVRAIRNEFAHDMNPITFESPHIVDRVRSLHVIHVMEMMAEGLGTTPKERFVDATFAFIAGFQMVFDGDERNPFAGP